MDAQALKDITKNMSIFLAVNTADTVAHEFGHKWAFNAAFPGIVSKVHVGILSGFAQFHGEYYYSTLRKSFECTKTRLQIAGGIAAGPIAGCLFNCALLGMVRKVETTNPNLIDTRIMNIVQVAAYFGIANNIGNLVNVSPSYDGGKLLSLFRKQENLVDPYLIPKLQSNATFQRVMKKHQIPQSYWLKMLKIIHGPRMRTILTSDPAMLTAPELAKIPFEIGSKEKPTEINLRDISLIAERTKHLAKGVFLKELGFKAVGFSAHLSIAALFLPSAFACAKKQVDEWVKLKVYID